MSDGRRKRRPREDASGGRRWPVIGGIVLGLLLVANLAVSFLNTSELGDPAGFLTPEMLLGAAFWVPAAAVLVLGGLSIFWVTAAWEKSERASLQWQRRGFLFIVMATMGLVMASWEPEIFRRTEITTLAMFIIAVQTVLFALGARADHAGDGRGRRRGRDRDDSSSKESSRADSEDRYAQSGR